jgi:hypothetical protein
VKLPNEYKAKPGEQVFVSLAGAKGISDNSKVLSHKFERHGSSPAECFQANRPLYAKGVKPKGCAANLSADGLKSLIARKTKAYMQCAADVTHKQDGRMVIIGRTGGWPATMCGLKGVATFAKKQGEPDSLVAILPIAGKDTCFPIRAMNLVAYEEGTNRMRSFVFEPSGVLRILTKSSTPVSLRFNNLYIPDVLSRRMTAGNAETAIFPPACRGPNCAAPLRKALVKDAILFGKRSPCGCWIQKRLICEKLTGGGYTCDQFKRLVRAIDFGYILGARSEWKDAFTQCKHDGLRSPKCKEVCTNRLLAS